MRPPHQLRAPTRACVSPLARWQELLQEMATAQAKYQSTCQFVVQYQKLVATNRARAAAGRNTRTAAAGSRKPDASDSGGAPPHSKAQATGVRSKSRPRFGVR